MNQDMTIEELQSREVSAKFALDACSLIKRGKALDVCARKLLAAAAVICPSETKADAALAEELAAKTAQVDELARLLETLTEALKAQIAESEKTADPYDLPAPASKSYTTED